MSDFSNRKDIRRAEKASRLVERARIDFLKQIMSGPLGREWLHSHLESCFIFGEPFVRSAPDATAWNLGRQSVGKQLFADIITNCPTQYVQMIQEASQKELANDRHDSNERSPSGEQSGSPLDGRDVEGSISNELDPFADPSAEA